MPLPVRIGAGAAWRPGIWRASAILNGLRGKRTTPRSNRRALVGITRVWRVEMSGQTGNGANWDLRWSRRGKIAAGMSRPSRTAPAEMVSFVYGDPDADSLPLEDMAEGAEFLAENNRRNTLA